MNPFEILQAVVSLADLAFTTAEYLKKKKHTNGSNKDIAVSKRESLCQQKRRRRPPYKRYKRKTHTTKH
ncbi:hypothetical protein MOB89_11730 [Bacillus inaquosorum]|uniref:hypothetical protein n=1 Tax=Bacillus inaquosorum TaxID=483913 RepID=UPI00227EA7D4|nr:hypothetical protein [Bacillus inaquosorum]MCY7984077.1 hypothetical protein [Bacillus inaquosorum]